MEEEQPKKRMGRPPKISVEPVAVSPEATKETPPAVHEILTDLLKEIRSISQRVESLETKKQEPVAFSLPKFKNENETLTITNHFDQKPFTGHFTESEALTNAARAVLGDEFLFEIDPSSNSAFAFTIVLPEKMRLNANEDLRRTKMVTFAEGINGVQEWAEKVKENLIRTLTAAGKSF